MSSRSIRTRIEGTQYLELELRGHNTYLGAVPEAAAQLVQGLAHRADAAVELLGHLIGVDQQLLCLGEEP